MISNPTEAKNKSRMGLGFLLGMLGAYIFVEAFVRLAYWLGLFELGSATNINYLVSIFSGLVTGILTIYISKERQLRILLFVVGTLLLMDHIAFFSNVDFSLSRMINRMLIDFGVLIGGYITYKLIGNKAQTEPDLDSHQTKHDSLD